MLTFALLAALTAILIPLIVLRIWGYFEGETFILDAWDEWKLSRLPLAELDARNLANTKRADVIVTCQQYQAASH